MISWKKIKQNSEMREIYLSGFSHGYCDVPPLKLSYLENIYNRGYDDGKKKKVYRYLEMISEGEKNVETYKSVTRN